MTHLSSQEPETLKSNLTWVFSPFTHPAPFALFSILLLAFFLRGPLLDGSYAPFHDSFKVYSFFHFFVQNIQNGSFPLWSHYTHSGEPFWPYIQYLGLNSPANTAVTLYALIGDSKFLGLLFSWVIFFNILIFSIGCLFAVPRLTDSDKNSYFSIAIVPIVIFGSISISAWQTVFGTTFIISFFPFFAYSLDRLIIDYERHNFWTKIRFGFWVACLAAFQLNSSNPLFFVYNTILFLIPIIAIRRYRQSSTSGQLYSPISFLIAFVTPLTIALSLPALYLAMNNNKFFPIGRAEWGRHSASAWNEETDTFGAFPDTYERQGDWGTVFDFFESIDFFNMLHLGPLSEIPLFWGPCGFFVLAIGLYRVISKDFLFPTVCLLSFLIALGDPAIVTKVLARILPYFGLMRHFAFWQSYSFFWSLLVISIGYHYGIDRLRALCPNINVLLTSLLFFILTIIINAAIFNEKIKSRIQLTPAVMSMVYPFRGDIFNEKQQLKVQPISPVGKLLDSNKSQGEPYLLYSDTVRFFDNGTQFTMPKRFWNYIKNVPAEDLYYFLRLDESKLQLLPTKAGNISVGQYSANQISVSVFAKTKNERLLYKENYFPGWIAYRNGERFDLTSDIDHPFISIPLEQGKNNINLLYRPMVLIVGYYANYLAQLIAGILIVCSLFRVVFRILPSRKTLSPI